MDDEAELVATARAAPPWAVDLWEALTWTRQQLRTRDSSDRLTLVPGIRGGLARLAWHEAGLEEDPDEDADEGLGPVVHLDDLLTSNAAAAGTRQVDPLKVAERVLVTALEETGEREHWDIPAHRPSGPYRVSGPTVRRYLDGVNWDPATSDPIEAELTSLPEYDTIYRLRCQFYDDDPARGIHPEQRPDVEVGIDPAGNTVVRGRDRTWFCIDWPIGVGPVNWTPTRVAADPLGPDNTPVFAETDSGQLVPLPGTPTEHRSFEYTWGYSGAGPSNLREAIVQLLGMRAAASNPAFLEAAHAVAREHVSSTGTPNSHVASLTDAMKNRQSRIRRRPKS